MNPILKLHFMQQMQPTQGINPAQAGAAQPHQQASIFSQAFKGAENNPFSNEKVQGVGLVNSDLQNMSYTLPNGKKTLCNTIGIA